MNIKALSAKNFVRDARLGLSLDAGKVEPALQKVISQMDKNKEI